MEIQNIFKILNNEPSMLSEIFISIFLGGVGILILLSIISPLLKKKITNDDVFLAIFMSCFAMGAGSAMFFINKHEYDKEMLVYEDAKYFYKTLEEKFNDDIFLNETQIQNLYEAHRRKQLSKDLKYSDYDL